MIAPQLAPARGECAQGYGLQPGAECVVDVDRVGAVRVLDAQGTEDALHVAGVAHVDDVVPAAGAEAGRDAGRHHVDRVGRRAGRDVQGACVGVLEVDLARGQPADRPEVGTAREEGVQGHEPRRRVGRVVDVDRVEAGRILDGQVAADALGTPGVAHVDRVGAAAGAQAGRDPGAADVDRIGGRAGRDVHADRV